MKTSSRVLLGLASFSLLMVFVFPLWKISLEAPQYPEGLGMHIEVSTISGEGPHDLRNINNLNHYIGMKAIEPDSIRELRIMPWLFGFMILAGLAAAASGRRSLLYGWFALFVLLALAGMVDFWLWEYRYGHTLNPEAAIKIPGMSYQPPLLGSKTILNFRATSWPALGGWAAVFAGVLGFVAVLTEMRSRRREGWRSPDGGGAGKGSRTVAAAGLLALAAGLLPACAPRGPEPVRIGEESCAQCLMTIADPRYASELILRTGKIYKFDSVECLAAFFLEQDPKAVASLWVTDFRAPSRMIRVEEAFFLRSRDLRSPMGMNLTAFGEEISAETVLNSFTGEILSWEDVLDLVRTEGLPEAGMRRPHGGHSVEGD